jgi:Hemerythrin HHE cation binding domain
MLVDGQGEEMVEPRPAGGSPREQLLEKLQQFERAGNEVPRQHTQEKRKESLAKLREATEQMRTHLARHLAPKELSDWRELPDSNVEIAAFGYELKMEHADLQRELGDLLLDIDAYDRALDRDEAASQIRLKCKALAIRIARHAAGEEAQLGRYTA